MTSENRLPNARAPQGAVLSSLLPFALLLAVLTSGCARPAATSEGADSAGFSAPTAATIARQTQAAKALTAPDATDDIASAQRGLVAAAGPLVVRREDGSTVWDLPAYAFIDGAAPESVNPSLWRQAQLNNQAGLYRLGERVYQLRGFDLANLTLIRGVQGWILVDPLTTTETARAAMQFAAAHLPITAISAVIFTHSHVDHFGGVEGALSVAPAAAALRVIAPSGFMEEATSENVLAGIAMQRRAEYMYGLALPRGPRGHVDTGLGKAPATNGHIALRRPSELVERTGQRLEVDGVRLEFQLVPGSEAPAEMTFYLPDDKVFCAAELVSHTLHNLYTLRGAKVRDAVRWSAYIEEARRLFPDMDVLAGSHHWPVYGHASIDRYLAQQADTYRYIHDQTLRLANAGLNATEIAERLRLPSTLAAGYANRDYYGTVSHNAKAVYQYYFGWYDGNPAHLDPLPPSEAGKRYVELAGGAAPLLAQAQKAFDAGDYRWAAELLNHLVFADAGNAKARALLAKTYEQLGYQAESGPWRDAYLSGAQELRQGVAKQGLKLRDSLGLLEQIPMASFLDSMAVRLNAEAAEGRVSTINLVFSDLGETHVLHLENSVLHHRLGAADPSAVATLRLTHALFLKLAVGEASLQDLLLGDALKVEGSRLELARFLALFDKPDGRFPLVTR